MRNIVFIILFLLSINASYSQDAYMKRMGVTKNEFQKCYDSISHWDIGNRLSKDIKLGKGEFYYVNNDTCFIYEKPGFWEKRTVDVLMFPDSVYVPMDINGQPISIDVMGRGSVGDTYTLCMTKKGKLGLFLDNDCISPKNIKLSPNKNFYLTINWFSCLLISKDWNTYYKIPTWNLAWFSDSTRFLYNNCFVDCDTNSLILAHDLNTGKSSVLCNGLAPFILQNDEAIMYFRDSVINGINKECVLTKNLKSGKIDLFFQIPDSLSYWSNGDDFVFSSNIAMSDIAGEVCYKIPFYPRGMELSCDYPSIYYINKSKKVIKIYRM